MIDLYTWTTPNGRKVSILLEELGVPYETRAIDIIKGDQFTAEYLAISPNSKIPAIVDRDTGMTLMESGAIMLYLAGKYDRFLPGGTDYWQVVEWLMWQMGGVGPMLGQAHHFLKFNPGKAQYAEERFGKEAQRLYGVLNARLEGREYVAGAGGGEYTIADMAIWPWISRFEWQEIDLGQFPNVRDWYLRLAARPAVRRGYQVPEFVTEIPMP
jgi:GST-like protein